MRAVDIIRKKRDAAELSREEIEFLISGATHEHIPDYQLAAFLMAVVWRGMTRAELAALTESMLHSGSVLDWSDLPGAKVDKHSTGGVGDKTSLIVAPIVAAAGLYVPMISGRGLGHTGGTLDKLEAIPGFNVHLKLLEFRRVLTLARCALIGQTPEIAPADKKLYALRDVTATVESPYLITASIMSKKMAEGIDALVLDVKTGDGAFMKKQEEAEYLAELMVETGTRMGKKIVALITDMEQPLGRKIGNALEVEECIEVLHGGGPADLRELSVELAGWMLVLGGRTKSVDGGRELAGEMIASGRARDTFREVVKLQGGEPRILEDPGLLPKAKHTARLPAKRSGYVTAIHCEQVGLASMILGGGREQKEDSVDPGVGLVLETKIGDAVRAGENLCTIHYNLDARLVTATRLLAESFEIGDRTPSRLPLVRKIIGAGDFS
jgi:pyrimidine-nucleoside phosphorylase/thymidine phosphorylase